MRPVPDKGLQVMNMMTTRNRVLPLTLAMLAWPVVGLANDTTTKQAAAAVRPANPAHTAARQAASDAARLAAESIARDAVSDLDERLRALNVEVRRSAPVTMAAN